MNIHGHNSDRLGGAHFFSRVPWYRDTVIPCGTHIGSSLILRRCFFGSSLNGVFLGNISIEFHRYPWLHSSFLTIRSFPEEWSPKWRENPIKLIWTWRYPHFRKPLSKSKHLLHWLLEPFLGEKSTPSSGAPTGEVEWYSI